MKRIAALIALAGLCLALVWAAGSGRAAASVVRGEVREFAVHPGQVHQKIIGFGAGFNEGAEQLMETIAEPQDRALAYDLLYGESAAVATGTRLNIVRLVVPPDATRLPSLAGAPHYDWANDAGAKSEWAAIQPIYQRTTPILYAVPFTPPAEWKTKPKNAIATLPQPGQGLSGGQLSGGSLMPVHYRDYADYLADFLLYYRDTLGHEIAVLSVQNEPGVPAPWHSCLWTPEEMHKFAIILGQTLQSRGLKTKLMLSEGTNWTGAWEHLEPALNDPAARQFIGVLASHSYNDPTDPKFDNDQPRQRFASASEQYGLPVWTSEMSLMQKPHELHDDKTMKAALAVAYYIHRDVAAAHASAWIYCFAIFHSAFPGSMGVLSPADGKAMGHLEVPKRFWAMANYSQFVHPGWRAIGIDGQLLHDAILNTGFVGPEGRRFVIVAVNLSAKPQAVHYNFGNWKIGAVEAHVTSETQDLALGAAPTAGQSEFAATLPPQSVTTFAGTLSP
ncbi:MAG: glycoside hydrolase [Rhizomicrobium sp.]